MGPVLSHKGIGNSTYYLMSRCQPGRYGSDDLFPDARDHAYHPFQSVNYMTCHDGFTLYDLVSYDAKRNWANGHQNMDGPTDNVSWNCGWEGDDGTPAEVVKLRKRQIKNFESRSLAFRLRGASQGDRDLYVMINAYWEPLAFAIQTGPAQEWLRVIDTSRDSPDDFREPGAEVAISSPAYVVEPRSVVVLIER